MLDRLGVAAPNPAGPYRRSEFGGSGWIDADRDCHNTRAEVLMQETAVPVTFNSNGCTVNAGRWTDPWSGYSSDTAADFEIDHTVALAEAWRSGAWAWSARQRLDYANNLVDPTMLSALHRTTNQAKGDRAPDRWRPPNPDTWCRYATTWAGIKSRWNLTVSPGELQALRDLAGTCPE